MQYLQDEYASILVNSHFDSTTSKLFRTMKKNTFGLNASSLETIQSAASLSAAVKSPPTRQCSGFSNRGYYRGGSRGYITTWPDRTRSFLPLTVPYQENNGRRFIGQRLIECDCKWDMWSWEKTLMCEFFG